MDWYGFIGSISALGCVCNFLKMCETSMICCAYDYNGPWKTIASRQFDISFVFLIVFAVVMTVCFVLDPTLSID